MAMAMSTPTPVHTPIGGNSPMSPRSYFQIQNEIKSETYHVTFLKKYLRDMLIDIKVMLVRPGKAQEAMEEGRGEDGREEGVDRGQEGGREGGMVWPVSRESTESSCGIGGAWPPSRESSGSMDGAGPDMRVSAGEFDALGFLLSGGEELLGRQVRKLSSLAPLWTWGAASRGVDPGEEGEEEEEGCPFLVLQTWLDEALCVNEALYPSPPDPFLCRPPESHPPHSLALPTPSLSRLPGLSSSPPSLLFPAQKDEQFHPHSPLPPLLVTSLNHGTVLHDASTPPSPSPPASPPFDPPHPPTLSPALPRTLPLRRVHVQACHDANVYLLGPIESAHIAACTDSTIVLGAVAGLVRVSNCERLTLVCAARRLVVCNCLDSTFPVYLLRPAVLVGDNRGCRLAPYNTCYPSLPLDLRTAGFGELGSTQPRNQWDSPIDLTAGAHNGAGGGEGGLGLTREGSHGGKGDRDNGRNAGLAGQEGARAGGESRILPPEQFYTLSIPVPPSSSPGLPGQGPMPPEGSPPTLLYNPFPLPPEYASVLRERSVGLDRLQQTVIGSLSDEQRPGVEAALVRYESTPGPATPEIPPSLSSSLYTSYLSLYVSCLAHNMTILGPGSRSRPSPVVWGRMPHPIAEGSEGKEMLCRGITCVWGQAMRVTR